MQYLISAKIIIFLMKTKYLLIIRFPLVLNQVLYIRCQRVSFWSLTSVFL